MEPSTKTGAKQPLLSRVVPPRKKRKATYKQRIRRAQTTPFLYGRGRVEALPALPVEPVPVPEALQAQVALAGERSACLVAVTEASLRALAPVRAAAEVAREGALSLGQQERMADVLGQVTTLEQSLGAKAPKRADDAPEANGWGGAVEALAEALRGGADWLRTLVAAQPASAPARHVGEATEAFLRRHLAALEAHTALELD